MPTKLPLDDSATTESVEKDPWLVSNNPEPVHPKPRVIIKKIQPRCIHTENRASNQHWYNKDAKAIVDKGVTTRAKSIIIPAMRRKPIQASPPSTSNSCRLTPLRAGVKVIVENKHVLTTADYIYSLFKYPISGAKCIHGVHVRCYRHIVHDSFQEGLPLFAPL